MNTDIEYLYKRRQFYGGLEQMQEELRAMEQRRPKYTMRPYEEPVMYRNNSRYRNIRTLRDSETNRLYHENINTTIIPDSSDDQYFTVSIVEENRLDIIANTFYNTPRYWWILAFANNIIDPFDVPVGTRLRIPPITSLYGLGGVLSGR